MTTIYNATDGPLIVDRAGRILGGRERREVDSTDGSPLAGHIDAGRIVVIETKAGDDAVEARDEAPQPVKAKTSRRSATTTTEEA